MLDATDTLVNTLPECDDGYDDSPDIAGPDEATRIAQLPVDHSPDHRLHAWAFHSDAEADDEATEFFNRNDAGWSEPPPDWGQPVSLERAELDMIRSAAEHQTRARQHALDETGIARALAAAQNAEHAAREEAMAAAQDVALEAVLAAEDAYYDASIDDSIDSYDARPAPTSGAISALSHSFPEVAEESSVKLDQPLPYPTKPLPYAPRPLFSDGQAFVDDGAFSGQDAYQAEPAPRAPAAIAPGRPDHYNYPIGREFDSSQPPAYYAPITDPALIMHADTGERARQQMMPAYEESSDLPWFVRGGAKPEGPAHGGAKFPDLPQTLVTIPPEAGRVSPYAGVPAPTPIGQQEGSQIDLRPAGIIGWLRRKVRP